MNNEFPTYDDFKEIKDKYDELKQLYLTLQREKNLFEESYGDVSARLVEAQKDRDMYKDLYNGLNVKNSKLQKMYDNANEARDKFITENAKLKDDYNKLVDENKMLTETLDKLRTKKPDNCENKWATLEEAEEFIDSLNPILSETPSVVINTKSINIMFDNHTNNFKEDDTND